MKGSRAGDRRESKRQLKRPNKKKTTRKTDEILRSENMEIARSEIQKSNADLMKVLPYILVFRALSALQIIS